MKGGRNAQIKIPTNKLTKITHIKNYMLAALFNAPSTMSSYYQAEVNHNMYGT